MADIGVVLLSAGSGKRMNSSVPKQYMDLCGKTVLRYSIENFENAGAVKAIIIVTAENMINDVWNNYVKPYNYKKVTQIIAGGKERYHSVYNGLLAMKGEGVDYVMIHDGARPFAREDMINRLYEKVKECGACIPAVPSKDTICVADKAGNVAKYPDRSFLWNVQTPQTFCYKAIKDAFDIFMKNEKEYYPVTDDAMVYKRVTGKEVAIAMGDYNNIKLTTPEDFDIAKRIVENE